MSSLGGCRNELIFTPIWASPFAWSDASPRRTAASQTWRKEVLARGQERAPPTCAALEEGLLSSLETLLYRKQGSSSADNQPGHFP